ncbi:hypothetical protein Tco_0411909 [Tanacetum coccineum]
MGKAVNADLVITESSGPESEVQDDSSMLGNDTDTDDTDIRPIYDEEKMAEVQLTTECIIFAIGQHHTEQLEIIHDVLGKPVLQSLKNQSVVRQLNTFKSERPQISKPRFASHVDVKKDLSKLVIQHYLPKGKESAFAKPNHMIASSSSRNSSKNMPGFNSNDMIHNHYLEEAKKNTQERNKNLKSSMMHTASPQTTTKGSKPKPRSNNQTPRSLPVSKSSCVTITAVPKADHSKSSSSFSDFKHFMFIGHRLSPNKTSDMYEKTSPRSDLSSTTSTEAPTINMIELESLFGPLFNKYFNGENQVVSKSSGVTTVDASDKRQQQPYSTLSTSTLATTVTANGNFNM